MSAPPTKLKTRVDELLAEVADPDHAPKSGVRDQTRVPTLSMRHIERVLEPYRRAEEVREAFCQRLASRTLRKTGLRSGCHGKWLAYDLGLKFCPVCVERPEMNGTRPTQLGWVDPTFFRYPWGGHGGPNTVEEHEEHASRYCRLRVAEFLLRGKPQEKMPGYVEMLASRFAEPDQKAEVTQ